MIGSNVKRALLDQVASHAGPVLSLYLDVNPANPDNTENAVALRAAEAMRGQGLDKRFVERIKSRLSQEFVRAQGRSLAIFASEDEDGLFDAYFMQTRLPLLTDNGGAIAHWGAPFVAPLLFTLDQKERYAVVYVASDRVRVFEVFLGQIEPLSDHVRAVDTDAWQPYRDARRSPAVGVGVAARGGAAVDAYRDRLEEASARLYRRLAPELEKSFAAEEIDRVILVGNPEALAAFREAIGPELQRRVVGTLPPPSNPDGSAGEWLPLVTDLVTSSEAEHETALLDRIREGGVWGFDQTLSLLQAHRLHTLVLPFSMSQTVIKGEDGRLRAGSAEAQSPASGETVEEVLLLELLPELVEATGTTVEFVEGDAEERLHDEFGGLAGITRW